MLPRCLFSVPKRIEAALRSFEVRRYFSVHPTTRVEAKPIQLRPYQETCLSSCLLALSSPGVSRIGVSLPTGAGKTTVFVSLISRLEPPLQNPLATRALIIVNSVELARQAAAQVEAIFPELTVEIDQGQKNKATGDADVTVATYQTLLRQERLAKYDPEYMKLVVVDEAHHAAAPSYRHILSHFHPDIRNPDIDILPRKLKWHVPIVGFSATFSRHDGLALGSVFERIVYHQDFLSMIKEQWLCNICFTTVKADIDLREVTVNSRSGEFNATSLAHVVNTDSVNELVLRSWMDRASSRKSTLIFCVNLSHLRDLTHKFREAGIDARYVYAGTPDRERKHLITEFRNGSFPVLLNVAILTEGTDIPNIDCIIIAKPTKSQNLFAQMIGRGMRQSPMTGKTDCHIIDFVDSVSKVNGVVSAPTLFGLDPEAAVENATLDELEERAKKQRIDTSEAVNTTNAPKPKSVTYVDYDDPSALVHDASGAPHLLKLSPYAWVGCGGEVYVLECLGKGYIRVETIEEDGTFVYIGQYAASATSGYVAGSAPYYRPRRFLTSDNLEDAIRGSDKFLETILFRGQRVTGLLRYASWRKAPATDAQKSFVSKKFKLNQPGEFNGSKTTMDISTLTKGSAANIITRLRHGAKARYTKKSREQAKQARETEVEQRRLQRYRVEVGPLPTSGDAFELQR